MIVDSSVFIAFYDKNDPKRDKAIEMIREAESRTIFISDFLLNELLTVALRKFGIKKANEILEALTSSKRIVLGYTSKDDFNKVIEIFKNQKEECPVSFVDCSIVYMAKTTGLQVATFDNNLLKQLKTYQS